MPSRRQRKLDAVVAGLQLQYGPRAVKRAAGRHAEPVSCIATTFPELDAALAPHGAGEQGSGGAGGVPRGRISEIIGPATSGKVTLAAKVLASAQRDRDALVAWLDLGRTCDPDYLHRCGLDLDRLLVVHPEDGADALAITLHLAESNALAALVFDGLADLSPAAEAPVSRDSARTGQIPTGLVTGMLERLSTVVAGTQTVVMFLTEPYAQLRTLAHVATVRLAIRRERWITHSPQGDVRGYEGTVEILKHRLGWAGAIVPIRITFNGTVRGDGL
jgi:recombination protein RecA